MQKLHKPNHRQNASAMLDPTSMDALHDVMNKLTNAHSVMSLALSCADETMIEAAYPLTTNIGHIGRSIQVSVDLLWSSIGALDEISVTCAA